MRGLTVAQKALILRASRLPHAIAHNVHSQIAEGAENKGYGTFNPNERTFKLNEYGLIFARDGIQRE